MPDDSTPQLRTSQTDHAQRLRTERGLMRVSGQPRSVIRKALASFAAERLEADRVAALTTIPKRPREPVVVTSDVQAFTPQPLTIGEIPGQGGPGLTGTHVDPTLNLRVRLLVEDGSGGVDVETVDLHGEIV